MRALSDEGQQSLGAGLDLHWTKCAGQLIFNCGAAEGQGQYSHGCHSNSVTVTVNTVTVVTVGPLTVTSFQESFAPRPWKMSQEDDENCQCALSLTGSATSFVMPCPDDKQAKGKRRALRSDY